MRVAIDYNAALRQVAGIGRYTRGLVQALAALGSATRLVLFYAARDLPVSAPGLGPLQELLSAYPAVKTVPLPFSERWLTIGWQRLRLPLPVEHWVGPIDLLHAPDFVLPPSRTRQTILTVHDLTFRIHPETAHARLRRYLDAAVPRSLGRARHVLADSQSTAVDLQRLLQVPTAKISVLYPGIGEEFRRIDDGTRLRAVRERYALPERFLLHVGTIEPRKNLVRLLLAFRAVASDFPEVGLMLAGRPGWMSDEIMRLARETPGVVLPGSVPDQDLPALYTLADGLVYPTLYEGFGFPPLEALACGTPALTSNTSSLPELVAGVDGALMIDPVDTDGIAQGLRRLLEDQQLARAARLHGPEVAARFGWIRAAHQLLDLYNAMHEGANVAAASGRGGA